MRHPRPRRAAAALTAASLVTLLLVPRAHAEAGGDPASDEAPDVGTQVVGGSEAADGQFPWAASIVLRGRGRAEGYRCTASVISRSWAMTAAHCVRDRNGEYPDAWYGPFVAPSAFDVVTGTNRVADDEGGGQRLRVAAIHGHPQYSPERYDWDVALLRLATPTTAPELAVIGASEGALDDAGTNATVAGWGVTRYGSVTIQERLRYVQVPVQSDATCASSYPPGFTDPTGRPLVFRASNQLCAGPMGGGKDACQGDSGAALTARAGDGTWRAIGVVSTGYRCAEPGYPGIYHRTAASRSWIGTTRRFGPFDPDGFAYIARQHRDFLGRDPTRDEVLVWQAHLLRNPAADLITWLAASTAWDANAGMNARLYRAAFGRNPDTSGLDYWVRQRWAGRGAVSIANHFVASSELQATYGSLDDDEFVTQLYRNVFDREPDREGRTYWVAKLRRVGRGQVLYELSDSNEYRRRTATTVRIVTTRFGILRIAPSAGEIAASVPLSQRTLIDTLRTSHRYASRFSG